VLLDISVMLQAVKPVVFVLVVNTAKLLVLLSLTHNVQLVQFAQVDNSKYNHVPPVRILSAEAVSPTVPIAQRPHLRAVLHVNQASIGTH